MNWRALAILAACAVGLAATNAAVAAEPATETCTAASARKATVQEVATSGEAELDRCVIITATMRGHFLYGGLDGLYGRPKDPIDPSSTGNAIGLYPDATEFPRRSGYFKVTVVGRVEDCQQTRDIVHSSDSPTQFSFVGGYCHYYDGRYLAVIGLTVIAKSDWERQLRSDDHPDFGNLIAAPADWPYRKQVEDLAHRFVDALQRQDSKALVALNSAEPGVILPHVPEAKRKLLRLLVHDPTSPFVAIGRRSGRPQMVVLLDRDYSEGDRSRSVICFCRGSDCTGRWPIDRRDADNLPSRPYACTELTPVSLYPKGEATAFVTQRLPESLKEPRRH